MDDRQAQFSASDEAAFDRAIGIHRKAQASIRLSSGGRALARRAVVLEQRSHAFRFGANWGESTLRLAAGEIDGAERDLAVRRNERFLALFNSATLPFYWGRYEGRRGSPDQDRLMAAALWYRSHGVSLKGHPLCWHTVCAPWLLDLSDDEILSAQLGRIRREMTAFAGVLDSWDVVNEAVIMPVFDRYDNGVTRICKKLGRINLIRAMFEEARASDPKATLLLNDFDISPAYDILVEGCLEAGIPIDAIGIQSHMHQGYWGPAKTLGVVERFERFGLPIHFTENTIVSGRIMPPEIVDLNDYKVDSWPSTSEGEARQAREVVLHYKSLFARPSVQSVTWWDLSDGGWLGAPAGLLTKEHEPKSAYHALQSLVKGAWWTKRTEFITDEQGRLSFEGFLGGYCLEIDGSELDFSLDRPGALELELRV